MAWWPPSTPGLEAVEDDGPVAALDVAEGVGAEVERGAPPPILTGGLDPAGALARRRLGFS